MKSHGQQVHVEGSGICSTYEPSTMHSLDTEWNSQSTWPTSFMLNMHISSPREVINPHPCLGRSYRVILCASQLPRYHLHCLPCGCNHVIKTKYSR